MKEYHIEVCCSLILNDRQTSLLIPFELKRGVISPLETFSDTVPTEGVTKQNHRQLFPDYRFAWDKHKAPQITLLTFHLSH